MMNKKRATGTEVNHVALSSLLAVWTGLEPATPCVTGRYSNQLNYHTVCFIRDSHVPFASAKLQPFFYSTKKNEKKIKKR